MLENVAIRILRAVFGGDADISIANPLPVTSETALDHGVATDGTITTLEDTTKDWEVNMWADAVLEVEIDGVEYHRTVISNTADTLTFNTLPVGITVAADNPYTLGRTVSPFTPLEKALEHNTAELAGVDILAAAVAPTATPCLWRVMAGFDTAGVFSVTIINGGNTQVQQFNGGAALNIDSLYAFSHLVCAGDTINYRYSVNAQLQTLRVVEIPSAI